MTRQRAKRAAIERKGDPTPERTRHGAVLTVASISTEAEAARPGVTMRRVQSPIERYAARGSITNRQAEAAYDLRADYEFGVVGARDGSRYDWQSGAGAGTAGLSAAQLDAATAYRRAVQALGKSISAVVLPVVIGCADGSDITVEAIANHRNEDRKQVMGALKLGLDALADHYSECPDRRRAAKYA